MFDWLSAILLGFVEGLTEFIPVSSTGHLLLIAHFIGFESPGNTFQVLIQLGAILALTSVYLTRFTALALAAPKSAEARHFFVALALAFLPAAVIGLVLHDFIKTVLYETPALVCITLIVGGVVLLFVDRLKIEPKHTDAMRYPWSVALTVGFCQAAALVPGVSRSGATIVGALLMGCDKRSAAEFSFLVAMPTMIAAFAYDLYANLDVLSLEDGGLIAVGFAAAFIAALLVVRFVLDFISRHGFALFAWWRIAVGGLGLLLLWAL